MRLQTPGLLSPASTLALLILETSGIKHKSRPNIIQHPCRTQLSK